jgi:hypothetical protein
VTNSLHSHAVAVTVGVGLHCGFWLLRVLCYRVQILRTRRRYCCNILRPDDVMGFTATRTTIQQMTHFIQLALTQQRPAASLRVHDCSLVLLMELFVSPAPLFQQRILQLCTQHI